MTQICKTYDITGIVQGVGFRPTVARLAREAGLSGSIQNRSGVVRLVLEGNKGSIENFVKELPKNLPPHARIEKMVLINNVETRLIASLPDGFQIIDSASDEKSNISIPADLVMCADCRQEIFDPTNRRYGYPFTTCTNCGPRYTVVNAMPYDRERTTLNQFPLCPQCLEEYTDETNRRYHAESTACPVCGPSLTSTRTHPPSSATGGLRRAGERTNAREDKHNQKNDRNELREVRKQIASGKIIAVRGIGGFALVVDAFNETALQILRDRKHRPSKPFAVMARNMDVVKKYCEVPDGKVGTNDYLPLLQSPEGPVVILDCRVETSGRTSLRGITPDANTLGVMLPTSPLHALLFEPLADDPTPQFDLLVMTSGNRGGEPICITNEEAFDRLKDIADLFLVHDREINLRNDDSLCVIQQGKPQIWRRARGYAPNPIFLKKPLIRTVLAMGAELKNTIALGFDDRVVLSPHVGDLEAPEAVDGLKRVCNEFPKFFQREPGVIAVDLHPDMHASIVGREIAARRSISVIEVQHHHAHAVSCLVENGHDEGLALVFDGTGLGTDGTIWGAELLDVTSSGFTRLATFKSVPLLGGDAGVLNPTRQLVARFFDAKIAVFPSWKDRLQLKDEELAVWRTQFDQRINAPLTHAAGRLFDSFSVLLGLASQHVTYEGQTAIRVESAARLCQQTPKQRLEFKSFESEGLFQIDWAPLFTQVADHKIPDHQKSEYALSFHYAVAEAALAMIEYGLQKTAHRTVALSGGVFMNKILNDLIVPTLASMGLTALIHRRVPPNDGGVALGQAVIAGMSTVDRIPSSARQSERKTDD